MSSLSGYVFCLSGTLTEGRAKVTKTINQNGGDVASTVNAKVTHLVTTPAEVAANTKKVITAQTKGTPIVAEGFLRDLLAGKRANVSKYSLTGGADDEEEEEEEEEEGEGAAYLAWDNDEVLEWVKEVNPVFKTKYGKKFKSEGIDGTMLDDIDDAALKTDLGITSSLHRKRLLSALTTLKESGGAEEEEEEEEVAAPPAKRRRKATPAEVAALPAAPAAAPAAVAAAAAPAASSSSSSSGGPLLPIHQRVKKELRGGKFGAELLSLRLDKQGARSSEALQASLIWNDIADLDLSCITPDGEKIYFGNRYSECGGWLDVDMNVNASQASTEAVENIFYQSAPSGEFKFIVKNYRCHTRPDTVFVDAGRSVPFRLFLTRGGDVQVFDGSVKNGESVTAFEFDHVGKGAMGSFVVMPPDTGKTTFAEACQKHGVTFQKGMGYYAVARTETIQANKKMLLHDEVNDTFTIGAKSCRKKLGWPVETVKKSPKDIPEGYRVYVQSTSHNRVIKPGTRVLMKVSVEEALRHRAADTQTELQ